MVQWRKRAAVALGLAIGLSLKAGGTQEIDLLMALPAATLTFSAPFIAEDGVGGFSFTAVCAAAVSVLLGVVATGLATSVRSRSSALLELLADGVHAVQGGDAIVGILRWLAGAPPWLPGELILVAAFVTLAMLVGLVLLGCRAAARPARAGAAETGTAITLPRSRSGTID